MQGLLRFAGCMRGHGLTDFPDPRADGFFLLVGTNARREIYGTPAAAKKQPPTPKASAALEACGYNGSLRGQIVMDPG
jgi:hypothetical protein